MARKATMTLAEYISAHITKQGDLPFKNETLPFKTTTHHYKKGEQVIKIGERETGIYFVVSGIVESVMMAKQEEKIVDFFFPGQFTAAFGAYASKQSSDININCLTDCVIEKIPIKEFFSSQKTSVLSMQLGLHMFRKTLLLRMSKEKNFLTKNAEERYLDLMTTRPEVIQQIPNSRVAKYLGIHPSSLSRLKKTMLK